MVRGISLNRLLQHSWFFIEIRLEQCSFWRTSTLSFFLMTLHDFLALFSAQLLNIVQHNVVICDCCLSLTFLFVHSQTVLKFGCGILSFARFKRLHGSHHTLSILNGWLRTNRTSNFVTWSHHGRLGSTELLSTISFIDRTEEIMTHGLVHYLERMA
jgi:hypothetical protein